MRIFFIFSLFLGAITAEAIEYPPQLDTSPHPNLGLLPRATAGNGTAKSWQWSDLYNLGKRQLYWVNKDPDPGFDPVVARQMAASFRADPNTLCGVKEDGKCLIGACDPATGMGLYLCNYRPQGFETNCTVFGLIATNMIDRWEGKDKDGIFVADFTEPSVQAYSYWSEDPTWVVMYTMPCLRTLPMGPA
ncbi:hypothetical protein AOL_s00210g363 [Orbilia oligospora ATCC 24927]|uniref:Uncharacterized protein n=2 Tax=Orbilia oligospora TaxID=2813651 RepID=G1XSK4_ARTOA|nr:hypothetical protein AOL_s00210g363 [Orbilia oligospora ATCC 24927]EGX43916.1 hypothetical protein AOL_s00210g363 [Orbilia oligospora ATCC 24927]KAF3279041.1 hypothetical protein TWF970_004150 [Orbilia oligospora]